MPKQTLSEFSIIIPVWKQETELNTLLNDLDDLGAEIILSSEGSRAKSMNQGALKATRDYLWFLHADSRINAENIKALKQSIVKSPDALHYFKLVFSEKGLSTLNAHLANLRSSIMGLPYGDQALCISKRKFELAGGYPEDTPYGEDLLFVRKAKQCNIKLACVKSYLISSARKYKTQGWLKTTLSHQVIMFKLLRKKI